MILNARRATEFDPVAKELWQFSISLCSPLVYIAHLSCGILIFSTVHTITPSCYNLLIFVIIRVHIHLFIEHFSEERVETDCIGQRYCLQRHRMRHNEMVVDLRAVSLI